MKHLLAHLKKYKLESVLGPLFKLLEASFELMIPLVVASIVEDGIKGENVSHIIKMCLILVLLAVVGLASSLTAQYFAAKAAVGTATGLRRALFDKMQKLSFTQMDKLGTSTMITRITSDLNQVQSGINLTLRLFLRSPFIVFGAAIMAFTVDPLSTLVFVGVIPLLCVVVFGIMVLGVPLYKKVQGALDALTLSARENTGGIRVIRAFRLEKSEKETFDKRNSQLNSMQKYVGKISALMNPLTYVLINIAIILLIYVGAIRVEHGILSQGLVIALYNYMSQILVELIKLANLIMNLTKATASVSRIGAVLELPEGDESIGVGSSETGDTSCEYAVEFRDVDLCYEGAGDDSLKDITFKAKRGQCIGIIGGTGCGKTSLVHMIPRFYLASKGEVLVDGVNVNRYDPKVLRQKVSIVMQKAVMFKGTIRENLKFSNENATDEELLAAIAAAQAADVVDAKGGLDAVIEKDGKNLSGGQRQRLSIARALAAKSEILILDDSSSALDLATDARLRRSLASLEHSPTVFIVSQRLSSIRNCDLILVLDDGRIVGAGDHGTLSESCSVYQEIIESQEKKNT